MAGLTVLSLCDGISCAQIALKRSGIPVEKYFSAEIKDFAIAVTQHHFPKTIQLGNVNDIYYKEGVLSNGKQSFKTKIDLVCFGSPCQTFSIAMNAKKRVGLQNKEKSGLFLECSRILKEVNPRYFFVENVGSMKEEDKNFISNELKVEPIRVNSKKYSASLRDRYYWTNISYNPSDSFEKINPNDILEDNSFFPRKKFRAILKSGGGIHGYKNFILLFRRVEEKGFGNCVYSSEENYKKILDIYNKKFRGKSSKDIDKIATPADLEIFKSNIRLLTQTELEKCQTLPVDYTNILPWIEAQDVIGDGWTIDVICQFFKNLPKEND